MKDMMLIENMFSVKDRIVLVTGCGGVATANARCFAKNGATVVMASRRMEKVAEAQKLLADEGLTIDGIQMDISCHEDIIEKVAQVAAKYGRIDVLIHTAANCHVENTLTFREDEIRKTFETNLLGTIFLNQEVGKIMVNHGFGRIINYNSIDAFSVNANDAMAYAVSKSGVQQATRFFAVEMAPKGVTVNGIAPVWINTPMMAQRPKSYLDAAIAQVPMGRMSETDDYLGIALYLASEAGKYVTGQTLLVDGGWSCTRVFTYDKD